MKNPDTICVHPISDDDKLKGSVAVAIFPSAAYNYLDGELRYSGFYSTYNQKRLGEVMANLEQGEWDMAFSSGMAAITTTILSFVQHLDHIIFSRDYLRYLHNFFTCLHMTVVHLKIKKVKMDLSILTKLLFRRHVKQITVISMKHFKKYIGTLIFATAGLCAFTQNPDPSVLDLWNKNDLKFNSPKAGNPLLPGYYADPTIIEENGTFYIYATSDMPS